MDEIKVCLQTITNPKDAKPGELFQALRTLDSILVHDSLEIDLKLRHFLEKRSYQKALVWIDGETPEKGVCGT